MLSRLYNYNADKFFAMLNALILEQDETPEITFDLQVVGDESVPDAIISQKSFKIVVETKLHNQFQQSQLEKHLTQFGTEEIKVLLTLDPKPMKESLMDSFGTVLKNYNTDRINEIKTPIRHVNITFEQLVESLKGLDMDNDSLDEIYNTLMDNDIQVIAEEDEDVTDEDGVPKVGLEEPIILDDSEITKDININDPVRMYLKEIGRISLLSPEEELVLSERVAAGDEVAKS